jgi:hypothetical protein
MTLDDHPQTAFFSLLVVAMLSATALGQSGRIVNVSGDSYESEELIDELDVTETARVVFRATGDFSGSITVKSATDNFRLAYSKRFEAGSLEEAEAFSEYMSVETAQSGAELFIDARAKYDAPWQGTGLSARLKVELVLPELISVDIQAKRYDRIAVTGPFSTVEISNEYGRVEVSNVTEMLKLDTENSRIELDNLKGGIEVSTSNNLIRAGEIDTEGGTALFSNEFGLIEISRFSGALECVTSYASIDLRGIRLKGGTSRISTTYGSIDAVIMEMQQAKLYVTNDQSNVELTLPTDVSAEFDLNIDRGGKIHLSDIPVIPVVKERERLLARTDDPESTIEVHISGIGKVRVKGKEFYQGP